MVQPKKDETNKSNGNNAKGHTAAAPAAASPTKTDAHAKVSPVANVTPLKSAPAKSPGDKK